MGFIQNKDIKVFSDHKLSDGHTISHEGNFGLRGSFLLESDIVTNFLAKGFVHLNGNSLSQGDGTDSSGLSDKDSVVMGEEVLRDLSGFTRASLSADDSDLIFFNGLNDLLFEFKDWEVLLSIFDFLHLLLEFGDHWEVRQIGDEIIILSTIDR